MTSSHPNISIITINFNNLEGLVFTVESVLSQNNINFEYIIIDGGSNDGSYEYLYSNKNNFEYWVSETDLGVYDAMNKGIAKAKGEYLIFLNSGDSFANSDSLESCFKFIKNHPAQDIYYGNIIVSYKDPTKSGWMKKMPETLTLDFFKRTTINHQASLIKRSLFHEIGFYSLKYNLAADYFFYLSCFLRNRKFKHMDFFMIDYNNDGMSSFNSNEYTVQMRSVWDELVPSDLDNLLTHNYRFKKILSPYLIDFLYKIRRLVKNILF